MTYALLIYTSTKSLSAEAEQRALKAHRTLQGQAGEQLHAVARLDEAAGAKTVRRHKGQAVVTDGPYMETKEWLIGFYLVDCDSEAIAIERALQICPDGSHAIEVRPATWTWQP